MQMKTAQDKNQMWTTGHSCQQFFRATQWKKLTKVQSTAGSSTTSNIIRAGNSMIQRMQDVRQQKKEERTITLLDIRTQANPWLQHTNWDQHLLGFQRSKLQASLNVDPDKEYALYKACRATIRVIHQALKCCHPTVVPRSALLYINRKETGSDNIERPFYSKHKPQTIKKYSSVWVKMLCYLWHSQEWEERPPYQFTATQTEAFQELKRCASRSSRPMLCLAVVHFWISMLDHLLPRSEFSSGLVSAVAVLGLDTASTGWTDASSFTPKLSAIITISRALVVYSAWQTHWKATDSLVSSGLSLEDAQEQVPLIFDIVQTMVQSFMCLTQYNNKPTPIDRILHMRSYGMKIAMSTKGAARVIWRDNYQEVSIDQVHFTMNELRQVVHGLFETCKQHLVQQLMFLPTEDCLPDLALDSVFDNHSELVEGWSFLDDTRNLGQFPYKQRESWLWDRMLTEQPIRDRFISSLSSVQEDPNLSLKGIAVQDYFDTVKQFKEELIVLCHLAAGAPARGPELLSVMHQNGPDSRAQRGLFIHDGLVEMVITYHKGFSYTQKVKIIHRYLPIEIGQLVVYYLWLVEPFIKYLQQASQGQMDFSCHIWEPEPESLDKLGVDTEDALFDSSDDEEELRSIGSGLGLLQGEDNQDNEEEEDQEQDQDLIRGSRQRVPQAPSTKPLNVDGFWSTNRLKRVMKRECNARIGVSFSPAQWRQVYPAIQRVHLQDQGLNEFVDQLYNTRTAQGQQTQSGHTQRTEDMIYGISVNENPFTTFTVQRQFRKLSQIWHQFLHFPSAVGYSSQLGQSIQTSQEQSTAARWARLRQTNLLAKLQEVMGPQAQFRGIQLPALQAVIARQSRLVLVIGTGGGKSLIYMLPAICSPEGLTILVVPLTSLQTDQIRRCKQIGLRVACWGESKAVRLAQVVLVTPESAITKAFSRFLSEKASAGLLDRVVVDECHIVLDSSHTWRPKLLQLSQIVESRCQLVYLTATLPPTEEQAFLHSSGLEGQEVLLLRDSTSRANIAYSVMEFPAPEQDQAVQRLVQAHLEQMSSPGQILLYCRSVKFCQHLGRLLDCPTYFRAQGSEDEKQAILHRLVQGQVRVIAATNALGLGIDAPSIRVIIHIGVPSNLRDYAQESGRAGRDGQASQAIIMRSTTLVRGQKVLEKGWNIQASMLGYIEGSQCRRVCLDTFLDGQTERAKCQEGEAACDICARPAQPDRIAREDRQHRQDQQLQKKRQHSLGQSRDLKRAPPTQQQEQLQQQLQHQQLQHQQHQHQQQEMQLQQHKRVRRAMITADAIDSDQLQAKFITWSTAGCLVCWAQGQLGKARQSLSWQDCQTHSPLAHKQMQEALQKVKDVQPERFSGCSFCWAPQAICQCWEERHQSQGTRTASYQRRPRSQCQFPGLVQQVGAALISQQLGDITTNDPWQWVQREIQKTRGTSSRAEDWVGFQEDLWAWLGLKVISNGLETCQMVWMIYHLS